MPATNKHNMKKHNFWILILIISLSAFSGCQTIATVEIDVMKPAIITLPPQVKKVALVNTAITDPNGKFDNEIQQGLFELDTLVSQSIIKNLSAILNDSPRLDTNIVYPNLFYRKQNDVMKPILWEDINELCKQTGVDAIISLDAIGIENNLQTVTANDGYGLTIYKAIKLNVGNYWRVYIPSDKQIVELQVIKYTFQLNDINSNRAYQYTITKKEGQQYIANIISDEMAYQAAEQLSPLWTSVQRDFFSNGNSDMLNAADYAYRDKWLEAAIIWQKYTNSENLKLASAACHNMALASEIKGEPELAMTWIKLAIEKHRNYISENYQRILEHRQDESKKLDVQFGIAKEITNQVDSL